MTNLLKCKKQNYSLTFNELLKKLNPFNESYIKAILKELILYNSKIIRNSSDIFFEKDTLIDFDYHKINKQLNRVVLKNYPVQYITKNCTFYGLDFYIQKGCFCPRQETEYILDWIISQKLLQNRKFILDLCSGSGVLANTIAYIKKNQNVRIIGVEKYWTPYKISLRNKTKYNLKTEFVKSDIFKLNKSFYQNCDFIICNPPYIANNDKNVDISTKKEPKVALYAKNEGYYFYFNFIDKIYPTLQKGTKIVFEIGFNQKGKLVEFLTNRKINNYKFLNDLNKNNRVLYMEK